MSADDFATRDDPPSLRKISSGFRARFVALRAGFSVEPDQLIEHLRQLLARYKLPQAIYIESALPKNAVGKIVKSPLRERLTSESHVDRAV